jgi:hypothetical protein
MSDPLLPPHALHGRRVGLSVSGSPDLGRLGLIENHFRLALGEIARSVLVLGGSLAYGGHLDPDGYTPFLVDELKRYSRRDRPLSLCLAWSEHRRIPLSDIASTKKGLGLYGTLTCLDPAGTPIDPGEGRDEKPLPETDREVVGRALTALRVYMGGITQGRVLLGGRRHGFQGALPGILEEALIALEAGQPVFLAGGFGGATLDVVRALEPAAATWAPPFQGAPPADPRWQPGIDRLAALPGAPGWARLRNGLDEAENRRLAATHRPSEIAALVGLGLGRLALPGAMTSL